MKQNSHTIREYITQIYENEIIIPHFQREYVWSTDQVKELITSLFYKVEMGSFLFFKDSKKEVDRNILPYLLFDNANKIYNSSEIDLSMLTDKKYVIDGQQRLTSLLIAFTDYFKNSKGKNKRMRKDFYIKLRWNDPLFGLDKFEFVIPTIGGDIDYDTFLESYIVDNSEREIKQDGDYETYIKLNDLYKTKVSNMNQVINQTVKSISAFSIKQRFNRDPLFDFELYKEKILIWELELYDYIRRIFDYEIHFIEVNDSLEKAVKTYEILNTSGKPLNYFDIIAAKYSSRDGAINDTERLYDVIRDGFSKNLSNDIIDVIDEHKVFSKTKVQLEENQINSINWNFSQFLLDVENTKDIPNNVRDQLIKLVKYIILSKTPNNDARFSIVSYKAAEMLNLDGKEIAENIQKAIECISWAGLFLQLRCGLRNINRINFFWQLFVIATVKYEIDNLENEDLKILEAWYFLSRFSGRYRTDQNENALSDLRGLINHIKKQENYIILKQMLEEIKYDLNTDNISAKDLRKEVLTVEKDFYEPFKMVGEFICEYSIRKGYRSNILENYKKEKLYVSTVLYPMTANQQYALNVHHLLPLDSTKRIDESTSDFRGDKGHVFNSPLNKIMLTFQENNFIGSKLLSQYFSLLSCTFIKQGSVHNTSDIKVLLSERYKEFFSQLYEEMRELINIHFW